MNKDEARKRLEHGAFMLRHQDKVLKRREEYVHGTQDLPFAPEGVSEEYLSLRKQSIANWMPLAVFSPIQRLTCDGVATGLGKDVDKSVWRDIWQANKMEARQTIIYESLMTHGMGISSVWPNVKDRANPIVRPQSPRNVWIEPDPDDPFEILYSVKITAQGSPAPNQLVLPTGTRPSQETGIVYDDESWMKFTKQAGEDWKLQAGGANPLKESPFTVYQYRPDANGNVFSLVDPLILQQDGINTIRFNMLLAMQYSAYRQRIVTGYDPVARDESGQIVYEKNPDGSTKLDGNGRAIPVLNSFGRAAVDRMLVFNGESTKVFDMPESNLANYVTMLTEWLSQFFATAQVPPQYLLSRMANLSGDAISGAESTLTSLEGELKRYVNDGHNATIRKARKAAGEDVPSFDMEMSYADSGIKSFAQITDGIVKLINTGFPKSIAWGMLPGANQAKVDRWGELADEESDNALISLAKKEIENAESPEGSSAALQRPTRDLAGSAQAN